MKKLSKLFLALAAFLILSGGLLAISGWATGGDSTISVTRDGRTMVLSPFGIHSAYSSDRAAMEFVVGPGSLSDLELGAFTSLDITVDLADITVISGQDYGVDLSWKSIPLFYELDGGTLRVWSADSFNLGPGDHSGTVTITLPPGAKLDDVYVYSDLGDMNLSGFTARTLTANASMGSLDLSQVDVGNAYFTLDLGDITGRDITVNGQLTVDSSMGSTDLSGTFHHMDLDSDMGDITVNTSLPRSSYSWDLSTDMGDITLDGKGQSGWGGDLTGGEGDYTITAQCDMSSIDLHFGR